MVWREANRDTALYALTNSDWRDGAAEQLEALLKRRLEGVKGLRKVEGEEEGEEGVIGMGVGGGVKRQNLVEELKKEGDTKKDK